jgi:hypothetical protein
MHKAADHLAVLIERCGKIASVTRAAMRSAPNIESNT